jgi:hypothetical protein
MGLKMGPPRRREEETFANFAKGEYPHINSLRPDRRNNSIFLLDLNVRSRLVNKHTSNVKN